MRRAISLVTIFIVAISLHAQQPPELPQKGSGPGKPLDAKEAQKLFSLDDWVYCANGLRGGKVTSASDAKIEWPVVDLSGMDFRFDPVNLDNYEAITGPGQFGNTFDAWGNRFICDNRHHLRHVVMEN